MDSVRIRNIHLRQSSSYVNNEDKVIIKGEHRSKIQRTRYIYQQRVVLLFLINEKSKIPRVLLSFFFCFRINSDNTLIVHLSKKVVDCYLLLSIVSKLSVFFSYNMRVVFYVNVLIYASDLGTLVYIT